MSADRLIYVLGTPSGGTSCVAGILHHLGVDMGDVSSEPTARGYVSFEDQRAVEFVAESPRGEGDPLLPLLGGYRRFRDYIEVRLESARYFGVRAGVKLGSKYWLADANPETLPLEIVRVRRPWPEVLASDLKYRERVVGHPLDDLEQVERAAAMGGYWHAAELLASKIPPVVEVEWSDVLTHTMDVVRAIYRGLNLNPSPLEIEAAWKGVEVGGWAIRRGTKPRFR